MPFKSYSKRGAIHTAVHAQLVKLLAVDIADQPSEQPVAEAEEPTPTKKKKSASLETVNSILAGIFQLTQDEAKLPDDMADEELLPIPTRRAPGANSCTHALVEGKLFSLQIFSPACKKVPLHLCHQHSF